MLNFVTVEYLFALVSKNNTTLK